MPKKKNCPNIKCTVRRYKKLYINRLNKCQIKQMSSKWNNMQKVLPIPLTFLN